MRTPTFKSKDAAAQRLGITEKQLDLIGQAAYAVYEECSYDLPGPSMQRAEIVEIALDANRPEMKLKEQLHSAIRRKDATHKENLEAALKCLEAVDYDILQGAMKLYFKHATYETGVNEFDLA